MKKRTGPICGILMAAVLVLGGCGSGGGSAAIEDTVESIGQTLSGKEKEVFREDIAGRIGNHIIYSYNVFEGRNLKKSEKEELIEYLEQVDAGLSEDVYVTGWTRLSFNNMLRFFGRLSVNGAVVTEIYYATDIGDPTPNLRVVEAFPVGDIDRSGVLDAKGLCTEVEKLAELHSADLNDYAGKGVYGDYLLEYDINKNILMYNFQINDYSHVYVDAITGNILKEEYSNGDIMD